MNLKDYPNVSAFQDHTGQARYRFRKKGVTRYLNGIPGTPEFDAAYEAAVKGLPAPATKRAPRAPATARVKNEMPPAPVVRLASSVVPNSFGASYIAVKKSKAWRDLADTSHHAYSCAIENFLMKPVAKGGDLIWRDVPLADFKRKHLNMILDDETSFAPHIKKTLIIALRKLFQKGMDLEWCESDPTIGVKYHAGKMRGDQPWSDADHARYCARWRVGTPARTCYALARWLGNRRGDLCKLRWDDYATERFWDEDSGQLVTLDGFWVEHEKGAHRRKVKGEPPKRVFQPITPMLAEAIAPLDRNSGTVLVTRRGKSYSKTSLTVLMQKHWTLKAGIEAGRTLHGLRFALGATAANAGVSIRDSMALLGHENVKHAMLYARDADQVRAAGRAQAKVARLVAVTADVVPLRRARN